MGSTWFLLDLWLFYLVSNFQRKESHSNSINNSQIEKGNKVRKLLEFQAQLWAWFGHVEVGPSLTMCIPLLVFVLFELGWVWLDGLFLLIFLQFGTFDLSNRKARYVPQPRWSEALSPMSNLNCPAGGKHLHLPWVSRTAHQLKCSNPNVG